MQDPKPQLTFDEAVAQFQRMMEERLDHMPAGTGMTPATPQEAEDQRFRLAEVLLGLACPDPRACTDQRCRRDVVCRHFARVQAKQASGTTSHPRRTPGAEAVRYAIWVFMSSAARPGS
jgi:hypothetical protein